MGRAQKSILIIEDHWDTAEVLGEILEKEGYSIRHAPNAVEALHVLTSADGNRMDAILLDLSLPDMDGDQVVHSLLKGGQKLPPVLIMSAQSLHSLKETAHDIGAAGIIHKPFDVETLLETLRSLLG